MATQDITRATSHRIRKVLKDRGLTQEWLAERSGISMRTLSRRLHEFNPSSMPLDELAAIADALDIPVVSLIAGRLAVAA